MNGYTNTPQRQTFKVGRAPKARGRIAKRMNRERKPINKEPR